jgi:alpha-2-macroglobulin
MVLWCVCFSQVVRADMAEGERFYKEGSYQLAHEAFVKVDPGSLNAEEKRWREFRLAETQARSQVASRQPDDSAMRQAETDLRKFIEEGATVDRVWAETQETFGDLQRGNTLMDLGGAWSFYEKALDYWGGTTNLNFAAEKYWSILRKAAEPARVEPMWYYGSFGTYIPLPVLENALKIARNEEEKARGHFMIAMTLRSQGGEWENRFRIPKEFEEAMKLKKDTRWYDDAVYFYGEWMSSNGRMVQEEGGNWRTEPDYEKALDLFRRLVAEFRKGETTWFDDAQNRIREITKPEVQLAVGNVFLPQSEIEFHVSWRNVESIDFTILKVDLTEDFTLRGDNTDWLQGFSANRGEKVKSWTKAIEKKRPYAPGNDTVRLEEKLGRGAYVIVAKGGNVTSHEMLLVTDASLVLQTVGRKTVVYACDSGTGAPLASANIVVWERHFDGKDWRWNKHSKTADEQGLARIDLKGGHSQSQLYAVIKSRDRQAFSSGGNYFSPERPAGWRIYAFPDKPAYRPGEKVQWKIIARNQKGETYTVPSGEKLVMRLVDPRGTEVSKETLVLNTFGSAWGAFELKTEFPLGQYRAIFLDAKGDRQIGIATLFRLEEYKLPEFKVAIKIPEENGRKKTFLLGEPIEVEISADYYFGGPVANASAEVVIHQSPYYHLFAEPREFEWFYTERARPFRGSDPGQVIQRETVKTDSNGKAKITIRTPLGGGSDLEYRIEARVTDASRREITGIDKVRVGQQRFYVHPKPAHHLYQPQDKVEVEFRAVDANEQPVATEGTVRVTRDFWFEIWLAPDGREVKGGELQTLQKAGNFPPPPQVGQKPWRLKFRGYQQDQILTRTLKSNTNGIATLTFTPEREGYYRIAWRTDEQIREGRIPSRPIRAETTVWVATTQSADLGYRTGGLEILADKDTFRAGQKAAILLSAPTNDRYVLLTTAGADLLDYQLVHLTGSVKLIELAIDEKHVPNFFINGVMVADQEFFTDQKEIVVPPTKNFLTVDVEADRAEYRPGEKGTLHVRTRNDEGQPVPAEIALTVFDESVSYIQSETVGDPRQFFFGRKRPMLLNSSSSFNYRPYQKLVAKDDKELAFEDRDQRGDSFYKGKENLRSIRGRASLQGGTTPARYDALRPETMSRSAKSLDALLLSEAAAAPATLALGVAQNADELNAAVQVRTDFRSAIFWEPDIRTDGNGRAEVSFTYPDSLTSWKAVARATTTGNQFGIDDATTRTKQPLIVRLQAPRFFLAGDKVTISAVINNNTAETLTVTPQIDAAGLEIENTTRAPVSISANGEARVDWTVHPRKPGEIKLKLTGRGGRFSDAMEKSFTVYEHGIEKFLAVSGKSREDKVVTTLEIPADRKAGSTHFTVQVTPSLAVTMLDALPYLIEYPYGCTEQTMSRFLPASITAKTLKDLGLAPEDVMGRVFGGIEQAGATKTHPGGKKNLEKLADITEKGLTRLYQFQHSDGGWGWWKEGDSDRFMTAYVVWGLSLAKAAGTKIDADVLDRAVAFLDDALVEAEREYDLQAFMLHALAQDHRNLTNEEQTAFDNLWDHRDQLNAYSRALFALAAHNFRKGDEAKTLVRNLANGVTRDKTPGNSVLVAGAAGQRQATAHWGEDGLHWRWSEGGVEATAFALRALLAIDPKSELIDPVANWLIKNRRGAQWSNTRDTAIVLLALNDYLRVTGEIKGELGYELFVNGSSLGTKKISGPDIFNAPEKFTVPENLLKNGANEIRIERKSGEAPIYFAAECSFFSLEEPITAAGSEIFVRRRYYKLAPIPTLLKGYIHEKQELSPGDKIASGERIETVLTIEAKNNYEYLIFEDLKPAGVEAVEIRSGESLHANRIRSSSVTNAVLVASTEPIIQNNRSRAETGETRWVYQELRDRKVALFIDKLPEGFWEIRYETRAEIPGEFHALPVVGHAMYVPEIRGNSAETKIVILDTKENHE